MRQLSLFDALGVSDRGAKKKAAASPAKKGKRAVAVVAAERRRVLAAQAPGPDDPMDDAPAAEEALPAPDAAAADLARTGSAAPAGAPPPTAMDDGEDGDGSGCEGGDEDEEEDYEAQRQRQIRENQEIMAQLGLLDAAAMMAPAAAPPRRAPAKRPPKRRSEPAPRRFSLRRRGMPAAAVTDGDGSLVQPPTPPSPSDSEPEDFDDSTVLKYAADAELAHVPDRDPNDPISKFVPVPEGVFEDPLLTKVYSMDFSDDGQMLAAAGHGGVLAVFSAAGSMAFKAHRGWVSQVQFPTFGGAANNLLISTSNDSTVALWDISKQNASGGARRVQHLTGLHSSGIFSMHQRGRYMATGSKDQRVVLGALSETGFVQDSAFEDHVGVIKCVRLCSESEPSLLASTGNDRSVVVRDLRAQKIAVQMEECHPQAINFVEWHPRDSNIVATTSFDTKLLLHDLRKTSEPLFSFQGHVEKTSGRFASAIYRAVFVAGGSMLATTGSKSQSISLYNTATGATASRGHIGFNATALCPDSHDLTTRLAVARTKSIALYRPV